MYVNQSKKNKTMENKQTSTAPQALDMSTIKNIVFDFGGVLIDWNPRYFFRSYFNDDERMEYFLSHVCSPIDGARSHVPP